MFEDENTAYEDCKKMYVWREVSVDGDIYKLRETRSSTKRGDLAVGESNELQVRNAHLFIFGLPIFINIYCDFTIYNPESF